MYDDFNDEQAKYEQYLREQGPSSKPSQLGAATDRMQAGMYTALDFAADQAGLTGVSEFAKQQALENNQAAEQYVPSGAQTFEQVHGVGDFVDYAGNVLVNNAPQFGTMLGAGALAAPFGPVAAAAAAAGVTAPMHMGEAVNRQRELGVDNPAAVYGATAANTLIDMAPAGMIAKTAIRTASKLGGGTIAKAFAEGIATEGSAEVTQGAIIDYNAGVAPSLEKEYINSRVEDAMGGMIGGGVMNAGAAAAGKAAKIPAQIYNGVQGQEGFDPMAQVKSSLGYRDTNPDGTYYDSSATGMNRYDGNASSMPADNSINAQLAGTNLPNDPNVTNQYVDDLQAAVLPEDTGPIETNTQFVGEVTDTEIAGIAQTLASGEQFSPKQEAIIKSMTPEQADKTTSWAEQYSEVNGDPSNILGDNDVSDNNGYADDAITRNTRILGNNDAVIETGDKRVDRLRQLALDTLTDPDNTDLSSLSSEEDIQYVMDAADAIQLQLDDQLQYEGYEQNTEDTNEDTVNETLDTIAQKGGVIEDKQRADKLAKQIFKETPESARDNNISDFNDFTQDYIRRRVEELQANSRNGIGPLTQKQEEDITYGDYVNPDVVNDRQFKEYEDEEGGTSDTPDAVIEDDAKKSSYFLRSGKRNGKGAKYDSNDYMLDLDQAKLAFKGKTRPEEYSAQKELMSNLNTSGKRSYETLGLLDAVNEEINNGVKHGAQDNNTSVVYGDVDLKDIEDKTTRDNVAAGKIAPEETLIHNDKGEITGYNTAIGYREGAGDYTGKGEKTSEETARLRDVKERFDMDKKLGAVGKSSPEFRKRLVAKDIIESRRNTSGAMNKELKRRYDEGDYDGVLKVFKAIRVTPKSKSEGRGDYAFDYQDKQKIERPYKKSANYKEDTTVLNNGFIRLDNGKMLDVPAAVTIREREISKDGSDSTDARKEAILSVLAEYMPNNAYSDTSANVKDDRGGSTFKLQYKDGSHGNVLPLKREFTEPGERSQELDTLERVVSNIVNSEEDLSPKLTMKSGLPTPNVKEMYEKSKTSALANATRDPDGTIHTESWFNIVDKKYANETKDQRAVRYAEEKATRDVAKDLLGTVSTSMVFKGKSNPLSKGIDKYDRLINNMLDELGVSTEWKESVFGSKYSETTTPSQSLASTDAERRKAKDNDFRVKIAALQKQQKELEDLEITNKKKRASAWKLRAWDAPVHPLSEDYIAGKSGDKTTRYLNDAAYVANDGSVKRKALLKGFEGAPEYNNIKIEMANRLKWEAAATFKSNAGRNNHNEKKRLVATRLYYIRQEQRIFKETNKIVAKLSADDSVVKEYDPSEFEQVAGEDGDALLATRESTTKELKDAQTPLLEDDNTPSSNMGSEVLKIARKELKAVDKKYSEAYKKADEELELAKEASEQKLIDDIDTRIVKRGKVVSDATRKHFRKAQIEAANKAAYDGMLTRFILNKKGSGTQVTPTLMIEFKDAFDKSVGSNNIVNIYDSIINRAERKHTETISALDNTALKLHDLTSKYNEALSRMEKRESKLNSDVRVKQRETGLNVSNEVDKKLLSIKNNADSRVIETRLKVNKRSIKTLKKEYRGKRNEILNNVESAKPESTSSLDGVAPIERMSINDITTMVEKAKKEIEENQKDKRALAGKAIIYVIPQDPGKHTLLNDSTGTFGFDPKYPGYSGGTAVSVNERVTVDQSNPDHVAAFNARLDALEDYLRVSAVNDINGSDAMVDQKTVVIPTNLRGLSSLKSKSPHLYNKLINLIKYYTKDNGSLKTVDTSGVTPPVAPRPLQVAGKNKSRAEKELGYATPEYDLIPGPISGTKTKTYAGVGTRDLNSPQGKRVVEIIRKYAERLAKEGYTLNTGEARGSDFVFKDTAEKAIAANKDENNKAGVNVFTAAGIKENNTFNNRLRKIALELHPNYDAINPVHPGPEPKLSDAQKESGAGKLKLKKYFTALSEYNSRVSILNKFARNAQQVFGKNLDTPVDFVIVYTKDGATKAKDRKYIGRGNPNNTGGSGQAIALAELKGIPVINLANSDWEVKLNKILGVKSLGVDIDSDNVVSSENHHNDLVMTFPITETQILSSAAKVANPKATHIKDLMPNGWKTGTTRGSKYMKGFKVGDTFTVKGDPNTYRVTGFKKIFPKTKGALQEWSAREGWAPGMYTKSFGSKAMTQMQFEKDNTVIYDIAEKSPLSDAFKGEFTFNNKRYMTVREALNDNKKDDNGNAYAKEDLRKIYYAINKAAFLQNPVRRIALEQSKTRPFNFDYAEDLFSAVELVNTLKRVRTLLSKTDSGVKTAPQSAMSNPNVTNGLISDADINKFPEEVRGKFIKRNQGIQILISAKNESISETRDQLIKDAIIKYGLNGAHVDTALGLKHNGVSLFNSLSDKSIVSDNLVNNAVQEGLYNGIEALNRIYSEKAITQNSLNKSDKTADKIPEFSSEGNINSIQMTLEYMNNNKARKFAETIKVRGKTIGNLISENIGTRDKIQEFRKKGNTSYFRPSVNRNEDNYPLVTNEQAEAGLPWHKHVKPTVRATLLSFVRAFPNSNLSSIAKRIARLVPEDASLFTSLNGVDIDALGIYYSLSAEMHINKNMKYSRDAMSTIIHESLHAILNMRTKKTLTNNAMRLDKDNAYRSIKEMENVRSAYIKYVIAHPEKDNESISYAATDMDEFISEALSNQDVMALLAEIPYARNNALVTFANGIRKFFGISYKDQNALNAVLNISEDIFTKIDSEKKLHRYKDSNANIVFNSAKNDNRVYDNRQYKNAIDLIDTFNIDDKGFKQAILANYINELEGLNLFKSSEPLIKKLNAAYYKNDITHEDIKGSVIEAQNVIRKKYGNEKAVLLLSEVKMDLADRVNEGLSDDDISSLYGYRITLGKDLNWLLSDYVITTGIQNRYHRINLNKVTGNASKEIVTGNTSVKINESKQLSGNIAELRDKLNNLNNEYGIKINLVEGKRAERVAKEIGIEDYDAGMRYGTLHGFAKRTKNKDGSYDLYVNGSLDQGLQHEIMLHEFGHIIAYDTAVEKMSTAEASAVMKEYAQWRSLHGKDDTYIKDIVDSKKTNKAALLYMQQLSNDTKMKNLSPQMREYLVEFDEWFADKASQALHRNTVPRTITQKFFAKVISALKRLFGTESKVDVFLRRIKKDSYAEQYNGVRGVPALGNASSIQSIVKKVDSLTDTFNKNIVNNKTIAKAVDVAQNVIFDKDFNLRRIGKNNKYLTELADLMYKPRGNQTKDNSYWHHKILNMAKFDAQASDIMRGVNEEQQAKIMAELYDESLPNNRAMSRTIKIRELFSDLKKYLQDAGVEVPTRKNYFPTMVNAEYVEEHKEDFLDMMQRYPDDMKGIAEKWNEDVIRKAEYRNVDVDPTDLIGYNEVPMALFDNIVRGDIMDSKTSEGQQTPHVRFLKSRVIDFLSGEDAAIWKSNYLQGSVTDATATYITQAVKRAEYEKRFGKLSEEEQDAFIDYRENKAAKMGAEINEKQLVREAKHTNKLNVLLEKARDAGASQRDLQHAKDYVAAEMGTHGRRTAKWLNRHLGIPMPQSHAPINKNLQIATSTLMSAANVMVLGLSTITSLTDVLGIAVRTGSLSQAVSSTVNGLRAAVGNDRTELKVLGEAVGSISDIATKEALAHGYNMINMTPGVRKLNDKFFHMIGLEQWTQATRLMAVDAAQGFIKRHDTNPNKHSERFLKELGLKSGDIKYNASGKVSVLTYEEYKAANTKEKARDDRVKSAISEFVDESVLRPNPSQRPAWASDPHYAIMFHLKSFMYSFQKTILNPLIHEARNGNYMPLLMVGMYMPAGMMVSMTKDLFKTLGDDDDDWTPTYKDSWSMGDYMFDGVEKAGLTGILQPILDVKRSTDMGQSPVSGLISPAIEIDTFTTLPLPFNYFYNNYTRQI